MQVPDIRFIVADRKSENELKVQLKRTGCSLPSGILNDVVVDPAMQHERASEKTIMMRMHAELQRCAICERARRGASTTVEHLYVQESFGMLIKVIDSRFFQTASAAAIFSTHQYTATNSHRTGSYTVKELFDFLFATKQTVGAGNCTERYSLSRNLYTDALQHI